MSVTAARPRQRKRGVITVFFVLISLVLVGGISMSLAIGHGVRQRIRAQNTADAAALAMATHAAQGMNMMSANNVAIGAAINVAGAIHILGLYLATVQVLLYKIQDLVTDMIAVAGGKATGLQKQMEMVGTIGGYFLHSAAGMSEMNEKLASFWMTFTPIQGVEVGLANMPGSLVVPLQGSPSGALPRMRMSFNESLARLPPKGTVCRAIAASEEMGQGRNWYRDGSSLQPSMLVWLSGPLQSVGLTTDRFFSEMTNLIAKVEEYAPIRYGYKKCGAALVSPLIAMIKGLIGDSNIGKAIVFLEKQINDLPGWVGRFAPGDNKLGCPDNNMFGVGDHEICVDAANKAYDTQRMIKIIEGLKAAITGDSKRQDAVIMTGMMREAEQSGAKTYKYSLPDGTERSYDIDNDRWLCPLLDHKTMVELAECPDAIPYCNKKISRYNENILNFVETRCIEWREFRDNKTPDPAANEPNFGILVSDFGAQVEAWSQHNPTSGWNVHAHVNQKDELIDLESQMRKATTNPSALTFDLAKLGTAFKQFNSVQSKLKAHVFAPVPQAVADKRRRRLHMVVIHPDFSDPARRTLPQPSWKNSNHFHVTMMSKARTVLDFGIDTSRGFTPRDFCAASLLIRVKDPNDPARDISICEHVPLESFGAPLASQGASSNNGPAVGFDGNASTGGIRSSLERAAETPITSLFTRFRLTAADATIEFSPGDGDPRPADVINMTMWPAWKPRLARESLLGKTIDKLQNTPGSQAGSKTSSFLGPLAKLLGS